MEVAELPLRALFNEASGPRQCNERLSVGEEGFACRSDVQSSTDYICRRFRRDERLSLCLAINERLFPSFSNFVLTTLHIDGSQINYLLIPICIVIAGSKSP